MPVFAPWNASEVFSYPQEGMAFSGRSSLPGTSLLQPRSFFHLLWPTALRKNTAFDSIERIFLQWEVKVCRSKSLTLCGKRGQGLATETGQPPPAYLELLKGQCAR